MATLVLWLVVVVLVLVLVLAAVDRWGLRQRRLRCAGCGAEMDPAWKAMVFQEGLYCSSECWWQGDRVPPIWKERDARPDA